ncbi:hypothetical protein CI109_102765 [Kwoniella shandongensis]|uniref:Peroxisomal ATPase PEX1 n=1 Tax=Kwoniella shandongensis TaxID=1734106 RepID=A0A5M6BX27_9TREE|nr:uncharacterized protein CI109_004913 [Kwoniella shandongensis]KAA5526710.1 hypothetical protein CI109_004913 [Kwoniella shandongensis]
MARKAAIKYRSLRSNLVHLPLSLFAQLAQQQARPQSLILHLSPLTSSSSASTSRQPKSAHLGWSGLAAASSLAQAGEGVENVEIDPEVAMSLGWSEGMIVEISVIHNPTKARSVSVTPLTPDDWEILEQHASFLENHLLSQLRAAQKGQELDVWVMGRTKIRIRVDETDPSSNTNSAVLVNPDTEIYVAPRPRSSTSQPQRSEKTPAISRSTSKAPNGNSVSTITKRAPRLRLVPPRVASVWGKPDISPSQLARIEGGRAALCSQRSFARIKTKLQIKEDEGIFFITLSLREDEDDNEKVESGEEQEESPKKEVEIQLLVCDAVPDGHVVVVGKTEEWMNDWASVTITPALIGKKGRTKPGKGKPIPSLDFPTAVSTPPLPGVSKIYHDALSYFRLSSSGSQVKPLLLLGGKGSGKTSLAKSLAAELEGDRSVLAEVIYEDVGKIDPETRLTTIKETMEGWLERATVKSPCILILDGLDSLIAPETELTSSANPKILADHFCRLFASTTLGPGLLVLITAKDSTTLHPTLNAKHIFGETLKIPPLTKEVRQEILQSLIESRVERASSEKQVNGNSETELDYVSLGNLTEGYSASDLSDLVGGATQQAIIRCSKGGESKVHLTADDFTLAQMAFTPLSLRGVSLQKSDTQWSDIGGLTEPRRVLRETLEWPTKYAQIFANCPLRLRSGLLLYGYPGCGKTLLASAVAKECGLNFISVKGPEILNKYIGASEKAVRDLFERASGAKPCVLFFDEFDSIAPKRGHDSTGVTDRVVNQMLTEMDGAQGLEGVYVLAATSRPDLIDPALLRPGRLDKSILCDMPGFQDRVEILQAVGKKLSVGDTVDWEEVASKTEGFSGADLQGLVYGAHLEVVHSSLDHNSKEGQEVGSTGKGKGKGKEVENGGADVANKEKGYRQVAPEEGEISAASRAEMTSRIETIVSNSTGGTGKDEQDGLLREVHKPVIEQEHLLRSLSNTRPSVSVADRRRLEIIYRSFVNERDGKMGNGDLGRETGTRVSLM